MRRALVFLRRSAPVWRRPDLLVLGTTVLLAAATLSPLFAQAGATAVADPDDFGQFVVDHQDELAPFFSKNAGDFFRLAVPVLLGMAGWVVTITMVLGWGLDVLMSRGYSFFYAPAFADWKRSLIYATGRLFLSFIYTAMMGLAVVLLLGFAHSEMLIAAAIGLLLLVDLAAQMVWILYLFRTDFGISSVFFIVILIAHGIAAYFVAQPILGAHASPQITTFVDTAVTPRLQDEVRATRQQLTDVTGGRNSAQAKVEDCQNQMAQAQSEQERLSREIEEKKNSDIYVFAQIIKTRAQGELQATRDQLVAFPAKFPGSPLVAPARAQLEAVNAQIAAAAARQKQQEADAARAAAAARANLLALAAKGEATLSDMRQALIGKSRAQVGDLLGLPSDTASDQWSYRQQMILNPLTGERTGLSVYFNEGFVQSVDYYRNP